MIFSRSTLRLCALLAAASLAAHAQTPFALQDGTPVRLKLTNNLTSATAQVGERVGFEVVDEVFVDGVPVIARGATALATVTEAKSKRSMGRAGKLDVNIDSVRLVNGEKASLRGVKVASGGGNSGKMTGAMVATSIVFFPAAPLFLFMKGKDITIPRGHEITVFIDGDVRLDRNRIAAVNGQPASTGAEVPRPAPLSAATGKPLSNEDVVALRKAGLGEAVILTKVRTSKGAYRLDAGDLVALKSAGVSDQVIAAMLEAQ